MLCVNKVVLPLQFDLHLFRNENLLQFPLLFEFQVPIALRYRFRFSFIIPSKDVSKKGCHIFFSKEVETFLEAFKGKK